MLLINLPESVCSVGPASFPRPELLVPDAELTEPRFEFDWLAKAFGDLGFLIQSLKGLNKLPPPFFFDFFVDEGWWAMEMRVRGKWQRPFTQ
jgi:hypothetical protein